MQPVDTHGFDLKEMDGPDSTNAYMVKSSAIPTGQEKVFYETAKFNPRSLIDLVENAGASSCNEATEEAHLPEINKFNYHNPIRKIKSIR